MGISCTFHYTTFPQVKNFFLYFRYVVLIILANLFYQTMPNDNREQVGNSVIKTGLFSMQYCFSLYHRKSCNDCRIILFLSHDFPTCSSFYYVQHCSALKPRPFTLFKCVSFSRALGHPLPKHLTNHKQWN